MQRLPRALALPRLNGAKPANAATCLGLSLPSSGRWASRVCDNTLPTPGTEQQVAEFAAERGITDQSVRFIIETAQTLFSPRMCSSMLRNKARGALARRFFSAVRNVKGRTSAFGLHHSSELSPEFAEQTRFVGFLPRNFHVRAAHLPVGRELLVKAVLGF